MMFNIVIKNPDLLLLTAISFLLATYSLFANEFVELSFEVYLHLISFTLIFALSYRLSKYFFEIIHLRSIKPFIPSVMIYFLALLLVFYTLTKVFNVLSIFGLESFMSFRTITAGEGSEYGERYSISVGLSFPAVMAAYYLAIQQDRHKLKKIFSVLGLLLAILSTSKIFILLWVVYILFLNKINAQKIALAGVLFITLFGLSHVLLAKFSSNPDDGILLALFNTFTVYFFGALAAYENLITGNAYIEPGSMLVGVRFFLEPFSLFDIPDSAILPWTSIGRWNTNNYTAFGYWFAFFGWAYVLIMSTILGLYYGLVFNKNGFLSSTFSFYRFFLVLCLIFVIFGDQFLPAFFMHVIYIFFSIILSLTKY